MIAFDLDGTLAYEAREFSWEIGEPIAPMIALLKQYLDAGEEVIIFTARISNLSATAKRKQMSMIQNWSRKHIGVVLLVTNVKLAGIKRYYDDRAVGVEANTGRLKLA